MSYKSRVQRHRNPKTGGEDQKKSSPFFGGAKKNNIRKKKRGNFFQPKKKMGHGKEEKDKMAGKKLRRLATSKEDEKLGTHDARMEKDKEEPQKPMPH
jgi:hypothetical protein